MDNIKHNNGIDNSRQFDSSEPALIHSYFEMTLTIIVFVKQIQKKNPSYSRTSSKMLSVERI